MKNFLTVSISLVIVLVGFFAFFAPTHAQTITESFTVDGVDISYSTNWDTFLDVEISTESLNEDIGNYEIVISSGQNLSGSVSGGQVIVVNVGSSAEEYSGNWEVTLRDPVNNIAFRVLNFDIINPNPENIWGNTGNGFWGDDFTAGALPSTLEASVQATGSEIWPLLIFSGIAIAFIIFLQVAFLSKKGAQPIKTNKKNTTFDIDEFNAKADELQAYFSKTGGASEETLKTIRSTRK